MAKYAVKMWLMVPSPIQSQTPVNIPAIVVMKKTEAADASNRQTIVQPMAMYVVQITPVNCRSVKTTCGKTRRMDHVTVIPVKTPPSAAFV